MGAHGINTCDLDMVEHHYRHTAVRPRPTSTRWTFVIKIYGWETDKTYGKAMEIKTYGIGLVERYYYHMVMETYEVQCCDQDQTSRIEIKT